MKMSEEKDLENIRESRTVNMNLSEQKITYISGGAFVLSISLITSNSFDFSIVSGIFLISSWIFFALTLFINLLSCTKAAFYATKAEDDIYDVNEKDEIKKFEILDGRIVERNKKIWRLNWLAHIFLAIGLVSIIIFASISINTINNNINETTEKHISVHKTN